MFDGPRPGHGGQRTDRGILPMGPQLRDGLPSAMSIGPGVPAKGMLRRAAWMARALDHDAGLGIEGAGLDMLARAISVHRAEAGTRLVSEGQRADFVAMIERGEVELYRGSGPRRVVVQILRSGDVIGDTMHFCQRTSDFSARAISEVTLLRISGASLARLLTGSPALCHLFLFSLASRLDRMQRRVLELARGDLRTRIASLLLGEAGRGSGVIRLPQSTLARLVGASRSSVNRILRDFEADGLIRLEYRRVEIVDTERLRGATL